MSRGGPPSAGDGARPPHVEPGRASPDAPGRDAPPDPAWATALLAGLRDAAPGASAVALAVRRGPERALLATGRTMTRGGSAAGPDTRFEIGSLTKTFTALLLAEMVARGEVAYDDPIDRYLPGGAAPLPRGSPITLGHLATHTSGLPRLPRGFLLGGASGYFSNPYAHRSRADLWRALARTRPHAAPGTRVRYSNLGVGLLGELLARAAHGPGGAYAPLLDERVLRPLGLTRTSCDTGQPQATGYWHGRARPAWRIPALPGAGAGRSSPRDLLAVLDFLMDPASAPPDTPGPLRAALADVTGPRVALPRTGRRIALVWNIRPRPGYDLYHHSGGTRGFTAFAGFDPRHRVAVAALANTQPAPTGAFIQRAYLGLWALAREGASREESPKHG
ncbi:serine hydrolase domain-containing protein [Streptomyces sp. NPDC050703]|uniref:serine hydrolase domain-containing protein n=1 Tax=Streptomyces sp. NPDC050703 TaxID=3157218 RepID=UPI0034197AC7